MILVFDIGGSKMRLAAVPDGSQTFSEPVIVPTPESVEATVAMFKTQADQLLAGALPQAVVGGLTRRRLGAVEGIKALFKCPSLIENDTALVGLGEVGEQRGIIAYLTVSTGVGGVRIIDGQIDRCVSGFEPGHQIIDVNTPERHLEDYVSGTAVRSETGLDPWLVTDASYWHKIARILAVGLHNTIVHWSPERMILGGSMFKQPGIKLADVQMALTELSRVFPHLPELALARFGDFGGLHGALILARQKLSV